MIISQLKKPLFFLGCCCGGAMGLCGGAVYCCFGGTVYCCCLGCVCCCGGTCCCRGGACCCWLLGLPQEESTTSPSSSVAVKKTSPLLSGLTCCDAGFLGAAGLFGFSGFGSGAFGASCLVPQTEQNLASSLSWAPQFVQYFMAYRYSFTSFIAPAHSSTTFSNVVPYCSLRTSLASSRVIGMTSFGGGFPTASSILIFSYRTP